MKRRIYKMTAKRQRLMEEALDTVRETREMIDPALLKTVREAIGAAAEQHENREYKSMQLDRVPVDQKKNLSVVLRFLEMKPDNIALQQEIRSFLTQN